ncbi:hypothetical protein SELSPUOL_00314 [Selenomonas sputigena ATCC 35185]|uniref:Uncharacterized protein n=1 Tax=Selenomonas sputigena (strain ATCC 35185 / DSM 20758 / CCUG 44933 / VPI D19B-28) TaxID=546271 RepID=C9LS90_SELS3|nr:hypothetical protein SELSPUOL_00314 [Selenomonas sputigena ATCC 35185]
MKLSWLLESSQKPCRNQQKRLLFSFITYTHLSYHKSNNMNSRKVYV